MKRAHYVLIAAPAWHNKFMEAADLFEQGKVLGTITHITVSFNGEVELTLERAAKVLNTLDIPEAKELIISFMHLASIELDDKIIFNDGLHKPYWNKEVRIISTGIKWFMLHDFIKRLGFQAEVDNHMYVKSIL